MLSRPRFGFDFDAGARLSQFFPAGENFFEKQKKRKKKRKKSQCLPCHFADNRFWLTARDVVQSRKNPIMDPV